MNRPQNNVKWICPKNMLGLTTLFRVEVVPLRRGFKIFSFWKTFKIHSFSFNYNSKNFHKIPRMMAKFKQRFALHLRWQSCFPFFHSLFKLFLLYTRDSLCFIFRKWRSTMLALLPPFFVRFSPLHILASLVKIMREDNVKVVTYMLHAWLHPQYPRLPSKCLTASLPSW